MSRGRTVTQAIRYGFGVGRVRVLEGRLLTNATLERLLSAGSLDEQKRVLADTAYASRLEDVTTATEVETALTDDLEDLLRSVETWNLPFEVTRFFRRPYDWANLRGRLKAEALGMTLEGLLVTHGTLPLEYFSGPVEMLPPEFRAADAAARDGDVIDRDLVDPVVDRAMHADRAAVAESSGCDFLVEIAALEADLANAKTLVRAKSLAWSAADLARSVVPGGTVSEAEMTGLYALPEHEMMERLSVKPSFRDASAGEMTEVERLDVYVDNLRMHHIRKTRLVATGVEPIIGYIAARQSELSIVGMLLVGKTAGLTAEALRRRLRDLYV